MYSLRAQNDERVVTITNHTGKSEEIDLPETMTTDLDSLMQLYNSKMYLKPDTDCHLPNINPVYDTITYKDRLSKLPTIIEMPYNGIVQAFIDRYTGDLRHSVAYILGAQNFYMPIFEEALDTYNLPLELKYLPVIESALNPFARSHVGAAGLWQFMLPTAKRYNLTINSLVDERYDIVKSSYAAAQYLRDLYNIFKDWNLVIAAYNCGPDKINKAIRRSHGERDYWKIYSFLPKETRGYVPAFIAANYIMNYYCEHNICPLNAELPIKTDTVMVNRDIHFEQIAHVLGISIEQLKDLNPQYRQNLINGHANPASLRLPAQLVNIFIDKEDSIYAYNPKEYKFKRNSVEIDDNASYMVRNNKVSRISKNDHKSKAVNNEANQVEKTAGQNDENALGNNHLSSENTAELEKGDTTEFTTNNRKNVVRSYDSVSPNQRSGKEDNNKNGNSKKKNNAVKNTKKNSKKKKEKQTAKHITVKDGDTLSEIAERNHTSVKQLRQLNGIQGSNIVVGKKIRVK